MMHVLSLIYSVIITEKGCKSQILNVLSLSKFWEKHEFWDILKQQSSHAENL